MSLAQEEKNPFLDLDKLPREENPFLDLDKIHREENLFLDLSAGAEDERRAQMPNPIFAPRHPKPSPRFSTNDGGAKYPGNTPPSLQGEIDRINTKKLGQVKETLSKLSGPFRQWGEDRYQKYLASRDNLTRAIDASTGVAKANELRKQRFKEEEALYLDLADAEVESDLMAGKDVPISKRVIRLPDGVSPQKAKEVSAQTLRFVMQPNGEVYQGGKPVDIATVKDSALAHFLGGGGTMETLKKERGAMGALQDFTGESRDIDALIAGTMDRRSYLEKSQERTQQMRDENIEAARSRRWEAMKGPDGKVSTGKKVGEAFRGGFTGSTLSPAVFLAKALGADEIADEIERKRSSLEEPTPEEERNLLTKLAGGAGSMVASLLPAGTAGKVLQGSKLGKGLLSAIVAGGLESASEGGDTYSSAIAQGMSEDEAKRAMWGVFSSNLLMNIVTDKAGVLSFASGKSLSRIIKAGRYEALQEGFQTALQNVALDRPWSEGVKDAALVGWLLGAAVKAGNQTSRNLKAESIRAERRSGSANGGYSGPMVDQGATPTTETDALVVSPTLPERQPSRATTKAATASAEYNGIIMNPETDAQSESLVPTDATGLALEEPTPIEPQLDVIEPQSVISSDQDAIRQGSSAEVGLEGPAAIDPAPLGSGTDAISNEEVMRAQRGDTYYKVGKTGVTLLGPQPDATLRKGEAIVMVSGITGKASIQNSNTEISDSVLLEKFGQKIERMYEASYQSKRSRRGGINEGDSSGNADIADNLGLQQAYEAGVAALKSNLGLEPSATDGDVVREVGARIGTLGRSVRETAIKIMSKIKGIARDLANAIAQHLHEAVSGSRMSQRGAIGPEKGAFKRAQEEKIKQALPNPDQKAARDQALAEAEAFVLLPSHSEAEKAFQKGEWIPTEAELKDLPIPIKEMFRKPRKEYARLGRITPARGFMSPAIMSMRDNAFQAFNKVVSEHTSTRENVVYSFAETIAKWKSLDREQSKRLGAALTYATGRDEGKGKRWSPEDLRTKFGLDDVSVEMYGDISDHMAKISQEFIKSEDAKLDYLVKTVKGKKGEAEMVAQFLEAHDKNISSISNRAYWPWMRFGPYNMEVHSKDGERIGSTHLEDSSEASVKKALDEMAAQTKDPAHREAIKRMEIEIDGPREIPQKDQVASLNEFSASAFDYMTSLKDVDPDVLQSIKSAFMAENAYSRRLMERKGVPGYSMDGLRVYQAYAMSIATRIANNKHGLAMEDTLSNMGLKVRGADYDSALEAEAMSIADSIRNPVYHPFAGKIMAAAFSLDFVARTSATLMNLTQQGLGFTVVSNFYGKQDTIKAFLIGNRIAAHFIRPLHLSGAEDLSPEEMASRLNRYIKPERFKAFTESKHLSNVKELSNLLREVLHDAARDGELRPKTSNETMGRQYSPARDKVADTMNRVGEFAGYFMTKSEQQNRIATLVAVTILAHQRGRVEMDQNGWRLLPVGKSDVQDTRVFAEFMNRIINFSSGPGNMAPYQRIKGWPGGLVLNAMQYKRFVIDSLSVLHNLGVLNVRNARKQGRWKTVRRVGGASFQKHVNAGLPAQAVAYLEPWIKHSLITAFIAGPAAVLPFMILKYILKFMLWGLVKMGILPDKWLEDILAEVRDFFKEAFMGGMVKLQMEEDENLAKRMVFALENGMTNMLPYGMAFNMNPALTPSLIFAPDTASVPEKAGLTTLGPAGGRIAAATESAFKDDYQKAWEQIRPRSISNLGKAISGEARIAKNMEPMKLTPQERILYTLGLQPTRVGMMQQALSEEIKESLIRKNLVKGWRDRFDKYPETKSDIRDEILIWNDNVEDPKDRINPERDVFYGEWKRTKRLEDLAEKAGVEVL